MRGYQCAQQADQAATFARLSQKYHEMTVMPIDHSFYSLSSIVEYLAIL